MEIEYSIKGSYDRCFLDEIDLYVKGLAKFEIKRVYIFDASSFGELGKEIETFKGEQVIVRIDKSKKIVAVRWLEDGKLHREDGPAHKIYRIKDSKLLLEVIGHYYKGKCCMNLFDNSLEEEKKRFEEVGLIILDAEFVIDNVCYITVLSDKIITTHWYWYNRNNNGEE